jgi:hypothetical protein
MRVYPFFSGSVAAVMAALLIPGCASSAPPAPTPPSLTSAQIDRIGKRIWQNECDGTVAGLTSWNTGEEFASLGIGHFIWYPKGYEGPFEESFPPLLQYLSQRGVKFPGWLLTTRDCPWSNRAAFLADAKSARLTSLRTFLKDTVREQTEFIIARLNAAMPKLIAAGGKRVQQNYAALAQSPEGMFAMIDYINFKGDGVNPKERYQGEGWGLAQVLGGMTSPTTTGFAGSAKQVLARRVKNAPPERKESRWLEGWSSRCDGYKRSL